MRKFLILFIFATLTFAGATRVDVYDDFLNTGFNANVQGLGNAGIISAQGPETAFYNPAKMYECEHSLLFSYNMYQFDHYSSYLFYRFPQTYRLSRFGIGLIMDGVNGVEYRTSKSDNPDQTTNVGSQAIIVAISKPIEYNFYLGLNLICVLNNYSSSSGELLYSLGFYYEDVVPLSVLFRKISDSGYMAGVGASYTFNKLYKFYVEADGYMSEDLLLLNLKYAFSYLLNNQLSLNCGYNVDSLTAGLNFNLDESLSLQYAYTSNVFGANHCFSLTLF